MEFARLKKFYLQLEASSRVCKDTPIVREIQNGVEMIVEMAAEQLIKKDPRFECLSYCFVMLNLARHQRLSYVSDHITHWLSPTKVYMKSCCLYRIHPRILF